MNCSLCGGYNVTWRGPMTNLTHTECADCGGTNCQEVEPEPCDEVSGASPYYPSSFPAMPLDAALEFADSGKSTGGLMTHEALKTLAAAIRCRRCEFCNELPLTETERKFMQENKLL
jgi:hypothetical protein